MPPNASKALKAICVTAASTTEASAKKLKTCYKCKQPYGARAWKPCFHDPVAGRWRVFCSQCSTAAAVEQDAVHPDLLKLIKIVVQSDVTRKALQDEHTEAMEELTELWARICGVPDSNVAKRAKLSADIGTAAARVQRLAEQSVEALQERTGPRRRRQGWHLTSSPTRMTQCVAPPLRDLRLSVSESDLTNPWSGGGGTRPLRHTLSTPELILNAGGPPWAGGIARSATCIVSTSGSTESTRRAGKVDPTLSGDHTATVSRFRALKSALTWYIWIDGYSLPAPILFGVPSNIYRLAAALRKGGLSKATERFEVFQMWIFNTSSWTTLMSVDDWFTVEADQTAVLARLIGIHWALGKDRHNKGCMGFAALLAQETHDRTPLARSQTTDGGQARGSPSPSSSLRSTTPIAGRSNPARKRQAAGSSKPASPPKRKAACALKGASPLKRAKGATGKALASPGKSKKGKEKQLEPIEISSSSEEET
ncbi:hypothetical protein FA95DRAFT_1613248 [Auriscalpium vulgare]|uniref:Uncharacterized protein n=1 Tax=Auriscalpium vulgare TaxID=40419 RepID=A0ACB8R3X5_9AGAM|nr:hypothetical protein FA95DRAFT_1613248 [Auriscalpium vulgare]